MKRKVKKLQRNHIELASTYYILKSHLYKI